MSEKLGQEPVFPNDQNNINYNESSIINDHYNGMSKRFYAACAAMQGMLTNMPFLEANANTAKQQLMKADSFLVFTAYSLADELLSQENEQ